MEPADLPLSRPSRGEGTPSPQFLLTEQDFNTTLKTRKTAQAAPSLGPQGPHTLEEGILPPPFSFSDLLP